MNRRDAVRRATGLAVFGTCGLSLGGAAGQEPKKPETPKEIDPPKPRAPHYELPSVPGDPMLERALENPFAFMFIDEASFQIGADAAGYELVFPAALPRRYADGVRLRHSSMVVFRADATQDDFTKKGGVYWKCHTVTGKIQFKWSEDDNRTDDGKPMGPLVLALRDRADAVRCYRLMYDFRC